MFTKLVLTIVTTVIFCFNCVSAASEEQYDSYTYQDECLKNGEYYENSRTSDEYGFIRCQCVSYVAYKLSQLFKARYWEHRGQADIMTKFMNSQYYMPQTYVSGGTTKTVDRWSNASKWRNSALRAEVGVTSGNFVWDAASYDAVFPGDVAWWDAWIVKNSDGSINELKSNSAGHVAFVESAERDTEGKGVACVTVSEYNYWVEHNFSRRKICKGDGQRFPGAFLHIDQDHAYCISHPDVGSCPLLFGKKIASVDGKGSGIGGGSDFFNLKVNSFSVVDAAGNILDGDTYRLTPGQAVTVKVEIKATKGDTHDHMRDKKEKIEIDLYWRQGMGDWVYLQREYTKAVNLPSGSTHTETVTLTVPNTSQEPLSFKAKIDAEDEAREANEGDNWTTTETFDVNADVRTLDLVTSNLHFRETPRYAGDQARFGATITNQGTLPLMTGIRSSYTAQCPGTDLVYLTDDGTDADQLTSGASASEETLKPVTLPNATGTCVAYFCGDYQGAATETDETNNCTSLSFVLEPRPKPKLVITKFQDETGCCTTNTGSRIRPDIWVRNDGPVSPGANVTVIYQISSPVATGGAWWTMGSGIIEPRELKPGDTDEDFMDGRWSVPKNNAWKKQWHTIRACIKPDGSAPTGDPGQGDLCATYGRYSKK